jgi:hypothetical protein
MVVGLSVFLTAVTVRFFGRRSFDAAQVIHRLRPLPLARTSLRLAPFLVVPLVCGVLLWTQITSGYQGPRNEKRSKEYWKQNLATWKDAPLPALGHVELDVQLEPAERRFEVDGHYVVKNVRDEPLRRVPVTGGQHWENISWSLDGSPYEPDDRSRLFVFTFDPPLAPAGEATIGFSYDGVFPRGVSKNGGGAPQFILPSGVVLHSFSTSFAPVLGYVEAVGVDEDNRYEPRHYDDDFHLGLTDPLFGAPTPYTTRIRVSGPERMRYNSVGSLVSEEVVDGRRTAVWQSDFPVTFFNIVAGEWSVREGNGTKIFYHPEHEYNIDEISAALDAARKYYSEWFMEYPWRELKLSEFPALASYAQGFPTNITFSEAIGFLTKSDPRTNMAFMVTAHEAAHQWWGNLLQPGKGPGGNILCWSSARDSASASSSASASRRATAKVAASTPSAPWCAPTVPRAAIVASCTTRAAGSSGCCSTGWGVIGPWRASESSFAPRARARTSPCSRISWPRCGPTPSIPRTSTSSSTSGSSTWSCRSIASRRSTAVDPTSPGR